jgi:hypothetical protein
VAGSTGLQVYERAASACVQLVHVSVMPALTPTKTHTDGQQWSVCWKSGREYGADRRRWTSVGIGSTREIRFFVPTNLLHALDMECCGKEQAYERIDGAAANDHPISSHGCGTLLPIGLMCPIGAHSALAFSHRPRRWRQPFCSRNQASTLRTLGTIERAVSRSTSRVAVRSQRHIVEESWPTNPNR